MGLFSKKKEESQVPRPLPPFMNNSTNTNSTPIQNELSLNNSPSMPQSNLPSLPKLPELNVDTNTNNIQECLIN